MSTNLFFKIADNLKPAVQQIVGDTVEEGATLIGSNAPVETGFMEGAVYYVKPTGESTYGQATPTRKDSYLLEEVQPESDTQGVIGAGASYSEWVNGGHHTLAGTWVPPQPFFDEGVAQLPAILEDKASNFESLLTGA